MVESLWESFMNSVGARLPDLLAALAFLLVGWLVALTASAVVRGIFRRTGLNEQWNQSLGGRDRKSSVEPGKWVGVSVYYLLMVFVLVGFFQTLGLTAITEPLNRILLQFSSYAPRLLSASFLLAVAWILAKLVKTGLTMSSSAVRLDERLGETAGLKKVKPIPVAESMANAAYWIVFLFFLPAVLEALALQGLLVPVQEMVTKVVSYLPNILAAALVLFFGWLAARILERITRNLLNAAGLDQWGERAGLQTLVGKYTLSDIVGTVVYILVLIPAAIATLDALQLSTISMPATAMLAKVLNAVPLVVTAGFVLFIAYLLGRVVSGLISDLLMRLGFNSILQRLGIVSRSDKNEKAPSEVVGYLVLVGVMLFAMIEAAQLVGFSLLAALLLEFVGFAAQVILGLVVFGFGLYLANLASSVIRGRNLVHGSLMATVTRASIIVLASAMALRQMGLANEIITMAFGLFVAAIAIAIAIAFGIGGREVAAKTLERYLKDLRETAPKKG